MIQKTIKLSVEHSDAELTTYIIENSPEIDFERQRPAVVICPGGSYEFTSDREAEAIAIKMLSYGFQAFVLRYSVKPNVFPQALKELATSVQLIRKNHQQWCVHPEKIIVAGFSAGGHLAASLGVFWQEPFLENALDGQSEEWQPDGLLLAYPVISSEDFGHQNSFKALLAENYQTEKSQLSLEKKVNAKTPPTFLWHTLEDDLVPAENTLVFAQALKANQIPFSLHIFPRGGHGLSLGTAETAGKDENCIELEIAIWPKLFADWVNQTFF